MLSLLSKRVFLCFGREKTAMKGRMWILLNTLHSLAVLLLLSDSINHSKERFRILRWDMSYVNTFQPNETAAIFMANK